MRKTKKLLNLSIFFAFSVGFSTAALGWEFPKFGAEKPQVKTGSSLQPNRRLPDSIIRQPRVERWIAPSSQYQVINQFLRETLGPHDFLVVTREEEDNSKVSASGRKRPIQEIAGGSGEESDYAEATGDRRPWWEQLDDYYAPKGGFARLEADGDGNPVVHVFCCDPQTGGSKATSETEEDVDLDGNGIPDKNQSEVDPNDVDQDGDGDPVSTDPNDHDADDNSSTNPDSDSDRVHDRQEQQMGTDPNKADTDSDGFDDAEEADAGTDGLNEKDNPGTREENDNLPEFVDGYDWYAYECAVNPDKCTKTADPQTRETRLKDLGRKPYINPNPLDDPTEGDPAAGLDEETVRTEIHGDRDCELAGKRGESLEGCRRPSLGVPASLHKPIRPFCRPGESGKECNPQFPKK